MDGTELDEVDLGGITLFADLTPSELEAIYQAFEELHAEPGTRRCARVSSATASM